MGTIDPRLQNPMREDAERDRAADLRRRYASPRRERGGRRWWQLWKRRLR